jgi:UDP-N-acetylglucosamine/UDP-N-acetylgalactosamine diphosphorylase
MAADFQTISATLEAHNQSHLLAFYGTLDGSAQQALLDQLARIDFEHLDELIDTYVRNKPSTDIEGDITPPDTYPAKPTAELEARYADARALGEQMIAEGKVAAFVVAG